MDQLRQWEQQALATLDEKANNVDKQQRQQVTLPQIYGRQFYRYSLQIWSLVGDYWVFPMRLKTILYDSLMNNVD